MYWLTHVPQEEEEYGGPIREINLESLAEEELECMREAEKKQTNGPATQEGAVGGATSLANGTDTGKGCSYCGFIGAMFIW